MTIGILDYLKDRIESNYNYDEYRDSSKQIAIANGIYAEDANGDALFGSANHNAIAHAFTSAYLAYDYSASEARMLGQAREYRTYYTGTPISWDIYKDIYNNETGIRIGIWAKENGIQESS